MILTITSMFFFLYQPAVKNVPNNFEITSIFQCLTRLLYLIHIRILSINLYLTYDSVYNDTWSYRNIQVKKRIWGHSKSTQRKKTAILPLPHPAL